MTLSDLIHAISRAIDNAPANAARDPEAQLYARVAKVGEESGEVISALIGASGGNPRKGTVGTLGDVDRELFDVALGALLAAAHLRDRHGLAPADLLAQLAEHAGRVAALYDLGPGPPRAGTQASNARRGRAAAGR